MTEKEIFKNINDGANYYVSLFGKAKHMNCINKEYYSYIFPKDGEKGITFIYNVNIENLNEEKQKEIITEVKSLKMPIWWNLPISENLYKIIFGKNKIKGSDNDEELYMAVLPGEEIITKNVNKNVCVKKVSTIEQFSVWAKITNDNLSNGYPDIHSENHYNLCMDNLMVCYICYENDIPVSSSAIMDNNGISSLEFVQTVPEFRNKGYGKYVCEYSIESAFLNGSKIITNRSINQYATKIYKALGFKIYNYML